MREQCGAVHPPLEQVSGRPDPFVWEAWLLGAAGSCTPRRAGSWQLSAVHGAGKYGAG